MIKESRERAKFFSSSVGETKKKKFKATQHIGKELNINVVIEGEGRIFTRQSEISGMFKNNVLEGKGKIMVKKESDKYEYAGEFSNGKKHGKGIEKFKFNSYDGDYVEDLKTGKGTLTLLISCAYEK